jgi:hypothetical protein
VPSIELKKSNDPFAMLFLNCDGAERSPLCDRFKVVNDFLADFIGAISVVIILMSLYKS